MAFKIQKFLILFALFSTCICTNTFSYDIPKNWPIYNEEINGEAGIVLDGGSNIVLYEKNPDKIMYPASLTKVMTALVVLDNIKDLNEEVFFSYNSCNQDIVRNSTVIGALPGDKLSVKECLYAILLPSANDVANALAEHVAGNIHDFSLLMNEKALQLGMSNTHFVNPTGLHNANHYTTARDLGTMLSYAIKNETFLQISSSISYTHRPIKKYKEPNNPNNTMITTNNLIISGTKYGYSYTTSGKTGYTSEAGYCLASSSKKNNMHLVCVTLNSKEINDRFVDAKNLFEFYHKNYKSLHVKEFDNRFNDESSNLSISNVDLVKTVNITTDDNSHITLPANVDPTDITSKIHFIVKNSTNKNSIGYIEYFIDNTKIGECEIIGNFNKERKINIQNLDISTLNNEHEIEILEKNSYVNEDKLFYKDKIGNLKISKGFSKLLIVLGIITILIIIISFTYSKIFMTMSESLTFIFNRLRSKHRRKRKLHKK